MATIGKNIAYYRKKQGYTQEELSEKMNVTSQAISKWENDLSYPDLTTTMELATVLQISVDQLLNGQLDVPVATDADSEQIAQRILRIHTKSADEEVPLEVTVRIPVAILLTADENGTLEELVGENASQVAMAIGMIRNGVKGTLVDCQTGSVSVQLTVEDYEN